MSEPASLYLLEFADVIEFDSTSMNTIMTCNGESWNNKKFKIIEITRNKNTLKIKAVEI